MLTIKCNERNEFLCKGFTQSLQKIGPRSFLWVSKCPDTCLGISSNQWRSGQQGELYFSTGSPSRHSLLLVLGREVEWRWKDRLSAQSAVAPHVVLPAQNDNFCQFVKFTLHFYSQPVSHRLLRLQLQAGSEEETKT